MVAGTVSTPVARLQVRYWCRRGRIPGCRFGRGERAVAVDHATIADAATTAAPMANSTIGNRSVGGEGPVRSTVRQITMAVTITVVSRKDSTAADVPVGLYPSPRARVTAALPK